MICFLAKMKLFSRLGLVKPKSSQLDCEIIRLQLAKTRKSKVLARS